MLNKTSSQSRVMFALRLLHPTLRISWKKPFHMRVTSCILLQCNARAHADLGSLRLRIPPTAGYMQGHANAGVSNAHAFQGLRLSSRGHSHVTCHMSHSQRHGCHCRTQKQYACEIQPPLIMPHVWKKKKMSKWWVWSCAGPLTMNLVMMA